MINKENIETKNKQKTLSDILKGADNFLFRTAPESVIGGISKGLGLGVDILSDYVKNPVQNISFDAATLGLGKGLKGIGLAAGLLKPTVSKGSISLFRGDERTLPTRTEMEKLIKKGKRVGGGKKIFSSHEMGKYPDVLYTSLSPSYAERYASGFTLKGSGNLPGTVSKFQVPYEYFYSQNKNVTPRLLKAYEEARSKSKYSSNSSDYLMRINERELMKKYGKVLHGNIGESRYPSLSDMDELTRIILKNPEQITTEGTYRFRDGIPIKFLQDLEFVPGLNTSQRTVDYLNNPKRIQETIKYLKGLYK
tara:strand:- start:89 stop:1012 length:924 start_codon:yes stop_codon:yes gene_type:complete